jgi:hypothetical protein
MRILNFILFISFGTLSLSKTVVNSPVIKTAVSDVKSLPATKFEVTNKVSNVAVTTTVERSSLFEILKLAGLFVLW